MIKLAFSYSHKDEALRLELETHLAALQRQGLIDTWHDRRIQAGHEFGAEIDRNFEEAQVILLLVSPDFIASDYCYNVEMKRALARHAEGSVRVIPVILRRCHWHDLPFGKLLATPQDGKPVTEFPSLDAGFYQVVGAVREALNAARGTAAPAKPRLAALAGSNPAAASPVTVERTSNLRLKRKFSDRDRDRARTECFEFVARLFENSLQELKSRNDGTDFEFRRIDANSFEAVIYGDGKRLTRCGIWMDQTSRGGDIYFSSSGVTRNSYNESMSVSDDGYTVGFKPMGMAIRHVGNDRQLLNAQGVAEYFWAMLIEPLQ